MLKSGRLRKRFYQSFLLTLFGGLAIVACTVFLLRMVISPPAIPAHAIMPFFPEIVINPERNYPAFDIVDAHPDDERVNTELPIQDEWVRRKDFFTLLLFGYDSGLNTDTIMVASFDAVRREAHIVSIPRDTRINVQRNIARINSAYPVGRQGGRGHDGGVAQLQRELQTVIGFIPDFYVSVEERAFIRIVDAVGGVNINVPFHMYYTDPCDDLHINIPAGQQRLGGQQALHFVRYRLGNNPGRNISDYQRMRNQQHFIRAMMDELLSPRTVLRIPEFISTYRDHVRTDLSLTELLWFAEQFVLGDVTLHTHNYPTESVRLTHWYEIPKAEEALELINRTINPFTKALTLDNLQLAGLE
ncbi:MAG: LCP family protein [Defluviitaleaceae bacterium]|nr:LCP family protein [Defluviitaleaceae bacterium]